MSISDFSKTMQGSTQNEEKFEPELLKIYLKEM